MTYRGRGSYDNSSGGNWNHGGGGRGRGAGSRRGRGGYGGFDQGPPEEVIEVGYFTHKCEDDIVCHTTVGKIPYFNAPIYFENKEQIGKIDEIFGGPKEHGFSVKLTDYVKASSFKEGQKLYIDPAKLLPVERFLNPNASRGRGRGGRGGDRGRGGRGSGGFGHGKDRGGFRGGRGGGGYGSPGNFRGGDRNSRGGGFRGGDRNSSGGRGGSDRFSGGGRGGFRGGDTNSGSFKRSSERFGNSTPQNKKIKFND